LFSPVSAFPRASGGRVKKGADLGGNFFLEVLGFAIPEKSQSAQKKGQAETCPYPQKEVKMKSIYTIPRKPI